MFTLHWQDHTQNLSAQLRSRAYADCALVAEDGHTEQVHRLVLSAASEYLADILKETTVGYEHTPRTTLILPIDGKTLEKLVHFVYNGEIELREPDVENFLEAGRWLGIKGLSSNSGAGNGSGGKQQPIQMQLDDADEEPPPQTQAQRRERDRERESPLSASSSIDSIPAAAAFNIERIQTLASLLAAGTGSGTSTATAAVERGNNRLAPAARHHDLISAAAAAGDFKPDVFKNSTEQHQPTPRPRAASSPESAAVREFNQRLRATDPRPCPKCGKVYRSAHTLRTHLEDKHTVCPGYRCVLCGTIAKSRNSLHSHMSRQHRGISTKDLPLVEVARGGSGVGGGGPGFDAAGLGQGHGQGSTNAKNDRMGGGASSFGDIIQQPNLPGGLLKGQPTTTGSAILDTYLHFIAENSLAAAAAFGGSVSNNTGSDLDSDDENGFGGSGGVGGGD